MIQPLDFEINPELLEEGFTQSEMTTWDNCAELWYLKYNLLLQKPQKFSWALTYGSWVHDALEGFYKTKGKLKQWNPEIDEKIINKLNLHEEYKYWASIGKVQTEVYFNHYKHDFSHFDIDKKLVELVIDYEYRGVRLRGMIDLLPSLDGKLYVLDHKTCSRIDRSQIIGWSFRFQFMFYVWLASKYWPDLRIKGFIPNAIKKPEIKQYKDEGYHEFAERVRVDMRIRPEMYFWREVCILKKDDLLRFEKEILDPKIDRLKMLLDPKIKPEYKASILRIKNTDHCSRYGSACEFLPLCQRGYKLEGFQYTRRSSKHEELEQE